MVGPGINGFSTTRTSACPMTWKPPRSCMAEAGYPSGFEVA